jgi:hypothetical protein
MRFNEHFDASHHGPPHPFKDARMDVDSLTDIYNPIVKFLFFVNRCAYTGNLGVLTGRNREVSNMSRAEALLRVLI